MRLLALAARLTGLLVLVLGATFAGLGAFDILYPQRVEPPARAPLVVVIGGGIREDGVLHPRSNNYLEVAIRFFREGRTDRLHFSGGARGPVPEAVEMRRRAIAAGVPAEAITFEPDSETTLQNALFTLRDIGPLPPGTVLVTDRAHLPRAWATFRWAGVRGHLAYPGDPWPREARRDRLAFLWRETLAVWYNAARMALASARLVLGADPGAVAASVGRSPLVWGLPE